jgi:hypothetical protein
MKNLLRRLVAPVGHLAVCIFMLIGTNILAQDNAEAAKVTRTCAGGEQAGPCPVFDKNNSAPCKESCRTNTVATMSGMMDMHKTNMFSGEKANTGHAVHKTMDGRRMLMLSDDFVIPDTPAPHWQVVDSKGNVYLLNLLKIKGDKYNQSIMLPSYIPDVAKVQIWCAWAEALLGEASFESPVR